MARTIVLSPAVLRVLHTLESAGYPAYLVGGSLRDALRGMAPHDFDITTPALPRDMRRVFEAAGLSVLETGIKHGTLTVMVNREPIECTTYRVESAYSDGRHPDAVTFTDRIADDLRRRDFTVNAMACRIPSAACADFPTEAPLGVEIEREAELLDLFGGQEDLKNGVLRCVGVPEERLGEDALRILRCVRFAVQLGFDVEEKTRAALRACRQRLACVSPERCAAEWLRMLTVDMPLAPGLALIEEANLWEYVLPTATAGSGSTPTAADMARAALLPPDAPLRMAQLLRHAGDKAIQGGTRTPEEVARQTCRALRLSRALTDQTAALLGGSYAPCPPDDPSLRRMMAAYKDLTASVLLLGGWNEVSNSTCLAAAVSSPEALLSLPRRRAIKRCETLTSRGDCLTRDGLALSGKELASLGFRGKDIGAVQSYLLDLVLRHPELNRADVLRKNVEKNFAEKNFAEKNFLKEVFPRTPFQEFL